MQTYQLSIKMLYIYFTYLIEHDTSPNHLDPHSTPVLSLTGQCRDFALVPWTDFRIISVRVSPKAIFFLFLALKNMSCWKIRYHFQVNRQCILYVKCWNHSPAFPYFPLHFQPKPLAERKSTWTALNPTLFLIEFTIQQINKAMQL